MGKSRRKQLRKIIVGGVEYKWLVENTNCRGNKHICLSDGSRSCGINIKIWDDKKKVIFDDLVSNIEEVREITPSFVKKMIINVDWYHMGV